MKTLLLIASAAVSVFLVALEAVAILQALLALWPEDRPEDPDAGDSS